MVILLCMTGAMYPAMDLTAGEKERGTIETILCSPVSRTHLVLGKFLMVLTASVATAVLSVSSMAVSFGVGKKMLQGAVNGAADAALVHELGLFDYLARRFAVYGTPEECGVQMAAAQAARLRRVVFTVSLAADPVATVELFGSEVLPELRSS